MPTIDALCSLLLTLEYRVTSIQAPLHRILPDGCVDIIFNLKARTASASGFVTGLMSRYEAAILTQEQSLFGIRFFAETVRPFIHFPLPNFGRVPSSWKKRGGQR